MKNEKRSIAACIAAILVLVVASSYGKSNPQNNPTIAKIDKKIAAQKERCAKAPAENKRLVCDSTQREIKRLELQKKKVMKSKRTGKMTRS